MEGGAISTEAATVAAIGLAAVLTIAVAAALLIPGVSGPARSPSTPLAEVVDGYNGTAVIRISGITIDLAACRIYLVDPVGALHDVQTAILTNTTLEEGRAAYIFYLPLDDRPAASGYWITDEPGLVFTADYHVTVRPFAPGGQWRIVVYDSRSMKNRVDQVLLITGPASPA
ncbi:MAG: hypothetical protein KA818_09670 [Methanoculleus sp.]|nr:hypothetical protein [Methanoculleus sp.]